MPCVNSTGTAPIKRAMIRRGQYGLRQYRFPNSRRINGAMCSDSTDTRVRARSLNVPMSWANPRWDPQRSRSMARCCDHLLTSGKAYTGSPHLTQLPSSLSTTMRGCRSQRLNSSHARFTTPSAPLTGREYATSPKISSAIADDVGRQPQSPRGSAVVCGNFVPGDFCSLGRPLHFPHVHHWANDLHRRCLA